MKNMEMDEKQQNFATQFLFYFMPCYSSGMKMFVSGFASRPSSCTYVLLVGREAGGYHVKKVCWAREKCHWFSLRQSFFHHSFTEKNELFSLHRIKSIWKMPFSSLDVFTIHTFIIILITFCVSMVDVCSSWICLMVFEQLSLDGK